MPKKLVLYLGVHKTATTTHQNILEAVSPALSKGGVTYIPLREMRLNVTKLLCDLTGKGPQQFFKAIDGKVKDTLLLSDENLLGKSNEPVHGHLYPFAEARIDALLAAFKDYDVEIVVALRDPTTFIPSLYCEYIRHYTYRTYRSFVSGFRPKDFSWLDTLGFLRKYRENGVKLHIVPFEDRYGGGPRKVLSTLEEILGVTFNNKVVKEHYNTRVRSSYSAEEVEAFRRLNEASNAKIVKILIKSLIKEPDSRFGSTKYAPVGPKVVPLVQSRYEAELDAFKT